MTSLLADLSDKERRQLLDDLNYLNMSEIKKFCDNHSIPYTIWIQAPDGALKKTPDRDRKGVILDRIRHYLLTGDVLKATIFPAEVVNLAKPSSKIGPSDRLYYGQYDKHSGKMTGILKQLTGGKFKNGATARIVAREFWSKGRAPTYEEFASAWLHAVENHKRPNPEWAFLSDLAEKGNSSGWKQKRIEIARKVLRVLSALEK